MKKRLYMALVSALIIMLAACEPEVLQEKDLKTISGKAVVLGDSIWGLNKGEKKQ